MFTGYIKKRLKDNPMIFYQCFYFIDNFISFFTYVYIFQIFFNKNPKKKKKKIHKLFYNHKYYFKRKMKLR